MRRRWLAAVIFLFTWSLTTHGKYSASGDEPHYLMITHSIVADHDIDLLNNYDADHGRLFGHGGLTIGLHALPARTGRTISIHDMGLAVFLIPVYVVARAVAGVTSESLLRRFRMDRGLFTYSIVGLFLMGMTTWGMVLVASGLDAVANPRFVTWLVLLAAISPPILSHAFLVFPEVVALFATALAVWFSLKAPSRGDSKTWLVVMLALGLLPWMHHKYLLYVPGLAFVVAWHRWALIRSVSAARLAAACALFLMPQLALHVWTWQQWGTLGGALTTEGAPFTLTAFKAGAAGLWIDRQSGLLAYAPIYWLLPACILLAWRASWPFLVPVLLLYLPAAAFVIGWWAGFAPAARYLVPALPLLLVPMAAALEHRAIRGVLWTLAVLQVAIDAAVWQRPRTLWPAEAGNPALELLGVPGRLYAGMLPAIQHEGSGMPALIVGIVLALGSAALVWRARERVRGPGLPAGRS
jgi:hypothetical protein